MFIHQKTIIIILTLFLFNCNTNKHGIRIKSFFYHNGISRFIIHSKKVACLGDSLTSAGYPTYLQNLCGSKYVVDNFGVGGNTVEMMMNRIRKNNSKVNNKITATDRIIGAKDYNYILILGGINNIMPLQCSNVIASDIISSLSNLYSTIKSYNHGIKIIAVTLTPFGNYIQWTMNTQIKLKKINKWILSKPQNVDYVIDLYSALVVNNYEFNPKLTIDGLHPNADGCYFFANYLWNNLFKNL